jgi:hypothetical protein
LNKSGIGTQGLKFRKAEDRNNDNLTISTAIFDENGNLLTGQQKILDLRLKEATLQRVNKAGLRVKSSFELPPGTFLVRIVVRDSEGAQMAAMNRGVVILRTQVFHLSMIAIGIKTGFFGDTNSLHLGALDDWTRQRLPVFRL